MLFKLFHLLRRCLAIHRDIFYCQMCPEHRRASRRKSRKTLKIVRGGQTVRFTGGILKRKVAFQDILPTMKASRPQSRQLFYCKMCPEHGAHCVKNRKNTENRTASSSLTSSGGFRCFCFCSLALNFKTAADTCNGPRNPDKPLKLPKTLQRLRFRVTVLGELGRT